MKKSSYAEFTNVLEDSKKEQKSAAEEALEKRLEVFFEW